MKKHILLISFITLIGCAESESRNIQNKKNELDLQVQQIVKNNLKDPASAVFRNQVNVCGEVNSKNSFGGYVGFSRFILTEDKILFENEYLESDYSKQMYQQFWNATCK